MAAPQEDRRTQQKGEEQTSRENDIKGRRHSQPVCKTAAPQNIIWNQKLQTLREFVTSNKLPAIARLKSGATEGELAELFPATPGPGQETEVVVRIHELGKRKMVLARHLQWEKRQNDFIVSGDQVEIPASRKGWFEAVPEDGRPVEYCDTVSSLYSERPRRFLVRSSTAGYRLSMEDNTTCWIPHEIRPGEVLTTGMMSNNMDSGNNTAASNKKVKAFNSSTPSRGFFKRLLKSSKSKNRTEQDFKYLQCFDSEGKEIMIPLTVSGVFSPVGDASMASRDAVYELQDLILAYGFPVNAHLVQTSPKEQAVCPPKGVLRLYGTREEEIVLLSQVQNGSLAWDSAVEKIGVSLERNLILQHGIPRIDQGGPEKPPVSNLSSKRNAGMTKVVNVSDSKEGKSEYNQVELPERVSKELKKLKSTGIFEKLSLRAVRKERAKLREMRSDDVFSKRIARHDFSYEDFYNGLSKAETTGKITDKNVSERDSRQEMLDDKAKPVLSSKLTQNGNVQSCLAQNTSIGSVSSRGQDINGTRRSSVQNRDLPPIPVERRSINGSKDSLYDHLPPAPQPPYRSLGDLTRTDHDDYDFDHEDGYMAPKDVTGGDSAYSSSAEVQLRTKPPAVPYMSGKPPRLKKSNSELFPHDLHSDVIATDDGCPINIDELFSSTYSKKSQRMRGPVTSHHWTGSTSQLYDLGVRNTQKGDGVPAWQAEVGQHHNNRGRLPSRTSVERLDLEAPTKSRGRRGLRSRTQEINTNATLRSHNLRSPKASVMELFHFGESFREAREEKNDQASPTGSHSTVLSSVAGLQCSSYQPPHFPSMRVSRVGELGREDCVYGDRVSSSSVSVSQAANDLLPRPQAFLPSDVPDSLFHNLYDPPPPLGGVNDAAYPKQGDDSAISVGSKENAYGFNNDGDISCQYGHVNAVGGMFDTGDCWSPPDDISGLSVKEVSRSLRYIGMKDRVVLRFANEQIDGDMLSSLDKRLLKEGFPELNALEIKKILDFVNGWRPKKL